MTQIVLQITYRHQAVNHEKNIPSTSQSLTVSEHPNLGQATITSKSELVPRPRYALIGFFKSMSNRTTPTHPIKLVGHRATPAKHRKQGHGHPRQGATKVRTPAVANQIQGRACSNEEARVRARQTNLKTPAGMARSRRPNDPTATRTRDAPPNSNGIIQSRQEM